MQIYELDFHSRIISVPYTEFMNNIKIMVWTTLEIFDKNSNIILTLKKSYKSLNNISSNKNSLLFFRSLRYGNRLSKCVCVCFHEIFREMKFLED